MGLLDSSKRRSTVQMLAWLEDDGWPVSNEVEFDARLEFMGGNDVRLAGITFVLTIEYTCHVEELRLIIADGGCGVVMFEQVHQRSIDVVAGQQFRFEVETSR